MPRCGRKRVAGCGALFVLRSGIAYKSSVDASHPAIMNVRRRRAACFVERAFARLRLPAWGPELGIGSAENQLKAPSKRAHEPDPFVSDFA